MNEIDEYYGPALERIMEFQRQGGPIETGILSEFKSIAMVARKELAKEILDDIKYGGSGGDDDNGDLHMVMDTLMREAGE